MREMPLRPAVSASHVAEAVFPTGVTAPMPVMTTRRREMAGFGFNLRLK